MDIREYRQQTLRTLPDLGSLKANLCHMALGLASEIDELDSALWRGDQINISEELADWCWYGSNLANYLELDIVLRSTINDVSMRDLVVVNSKICDQIKKFMAYNKLYDRTALQTLVQEGFDICFNFNVTPGKKVDLPLALERNIAKLRKRFPDKFDEQKAQNRDLDAEREALEGK